MDAPTAKSWLCRNVRVDDKEIGLAVVSADGDGNLIAAEPFVRETPSTVYFDGYIEVRHGKVRLLPR